MAAATAVRKEAKAAVRHAAYLLDETLPEAMRPANGAQKLTVALVWRGTVVELSDCPKDRPFTVGPRGATLQVVHDIASGKPVPLFRPVNGGYEVLLPEGVEATLRRGDRAWTGRGLADAGEARAVDLPCRGHVTTLTLNDRISVRFGEVTLVARFTRPEAMPVRSWRDRMDATFLSTIAIAVFAAIVLTRMFAIAETTQFDFGGEGLKNAGTYVQHIVHAAPPPQLSRKDPAPQPQKGPGKEGMAGKPDATRRATALTRPGGGPDRLAQNKAIVNNTGLLKLLGASGGPLADVLRPGSVGINTGLGNLVASNDVGDQIGVNGLGTRGNGPGGGCPACDVRIGTIADPRMRSKNYGPGLSLDGMGKKSAPLPPTIHTEEIGYDKDVIARIVRRHWNEIRYCYEKALNQNPNLSGKVAIRFTIGPVGDVSEVASSDVTLDSNEAVECMLGNVRRWQFPAPKGGGTVDVTYPFLFQAN